MQTWRVPPGGQIDGLRLVTEPGAQPGAGQVRVRLAAGSLNFRDLMVIRGGYPVSGTGALVPGSDGVGTVVEIGPAVTRFAVGDRVATSFFPDWVDGPMTPAGVATALGAGGVGTFAEELVLGEHSLVKSPAHLTDAEAATLTCVGTTAWHALFETARVQPGDTVVLLGTGGISVFALQLAKAAGCRTIITSSSDAKLERARELGADETINYLRVPEWSTEVRRLTAGAGADLVIEVGGEKTLPQSLASVRMQGTIVTVGAVSGAGGGVPPRALIPGALRLQGVYVGPRRMHEKLAHFVEVTRLRPVVDRSFALSELPEAYRYFHTGQHFGKVTLLAG
ncbi:MAG TPA: NAD(P)-dependent alcohol dehydrogenase [Steroidobacteraceae bacterium]|nr:NAD(P)-dependent alcohol dehydrogenase [Steroidobacteraceae bacterium]